MRPSRTRWLSRPHRPTVVIVVCAAIAPGLTISGGPARAQTTQPCPVPPLVTPPSPNLAAASATLVPADACVPASISSVPFQYFDDFSWRAFIALVWPARAGARGAPDPNQKLGAANVPLVFETYKSDWETFQKDTGAPTPWNSYDFHLVPCGNAADIKSGDLVLGSFSELGNVGEAGKNRFVNVLVAQNRTYVRYLAAYDATEFNDIVSKQLYLPAKVPAPTPGPVQVASPVGAITVKSAWIEMTGIANPDRFYTRMAWVKQLKSEVCVLTKVGLVGLHIVVKTPTRPQWIWATFEQVDTVPAAPGVKTAATFNDGAGTPMPAIGKLSPDYFVNTAPASPPPPFNVDRVKPIAGTTPDTKAPGDTATTNATWRAALRVLGQQQGQPVVWQYYQLTMTQWPLNPNSRDDASPAHTFPGSNTAGLGPTAFANTTLETFDQASAFTGCMACHNATRSTDFIWSLPMHGGAPPAATVVARAAARPGMHARTAPVVPGQRVKALSELREIIEHSGQ